MLLNQGQDQLADLSIAFCSSFLCHRFNIEWTISLWKQVIYLWEWVIYVWEWLIRSHLKHRWDSGSYTSYTLPMDHRFSLKWVIWGSGKATELPGDEGNDGDDL